MSTAFDSGAGFKPANVVQDSGRLGNLPHSPPRDGATLDPAASRCHPASLALRCRYIFSATAALFIMAVGSVLMLIVGIVTLFQTRRFQTEVMLRRLSQAAFWISGVKMIVHDQPRPTRQVV